MILSARQVSKSYGARQVLKEVSLTCSEGEICGLIGPNGAGKSTLFRILMGLVSLDSGSLDLRSKSPKPLGGIIEKPALYGYLSARENLRVFSRIQGLTLTAKHYGALMEQVGLSPDRHDPVRNYSMGMKQRLGLAIALLNNPDCVILDEPFSGLDPIGIRALQDQVRTLAGKRGIGVLISSHNLVELGDLCDRLYVINQGEIIREGPAQKVLQAAARGYLLFGEGLQGSRVLNSLHVEYRKGSALLFPDSRPIGAILNELTREEGVTLRGCIPQTDLRTLFEKEAS
ncbi:MAG: ABC transporter ATP-binding protein [Robiginitalea sp.]|jgi:ABC-2 type transport system ATP-binding protein